MLLAGVPRDEKQFTKTCSVLPAEPQPPTLQRVRSSPRAMTCTWPPMVLPRFGISTRYWPVPMFETLMVPPPELSENAESAGALPVVFVEDAKAMSPGMVVHACCSDAVSSPPDGVLSAQPVAPQQTANAPPNINGRIFECFM